MPIADKHSCILIHIPKTAGTSMEYVLGMHGDKEMLGIVKCLILITFLVKIYSI